MSTQTNPSLSAAEDIFKHLVWDPVVESGMVYLFAQAPFLDAPIIGTINRAVIKKVSGWFFLQIRLFIDITGVRLINNEYQTAFEKASVVLKIIAHDKGIDSNEFKAARENAKAALSKFTQFNHQ